MDQGRCHHRLLATAREALSGACMQKPLPNMRLKLPGALVGGIAFPRQLAFLSAAPRPCAFGHCARSLSAIR